MKNIINRIDTGTLVLFILAFMSLLLTNCESGKPSPFSIIPRPLEAFKESGRFVIDSNTSLVLEGGDSLEIIGNYLKNRLANVA
jgi:hypothetical protein